MLNEDKMRLMTGIAMFEKREEKRILPANRYFRGDYITSHLLRAFFSYTFCYCLCVLIWILYDSEYLLNAMSLGDVASPARTGGIFYAVGLVFYLLVTGIVFNKRYEYAKRGMNVYLSKLKRLERRYESQARIKAREKGGMPR